MRGWRFAVVLTLAVAACVGLLVWLSVHLAGRERERAEESVRQAAVRAVRESAEGFLSRLEKRLASLETGMAGWRAAKRLPAIRGMLVWRGAKLVFPVASAPYDDAPEEPEDAEVAAAERARDVEVLDGLAERHPQAALAAARLLAERGEVTRALARLDRVGGGRVGAMPARVAAAFLGLRLAQRRCGWRVVGARAAILGGALVEGGPVWRPVWERMREALERALSGGGERWSDDDRKAVEEAVERLGLAAKWLDLLRTHPGPPAGQAGWVTENGRAVAVVERDGEVSAVFFDAEEMLSALVESVRGRTEGLAEVSLSEGGEVRLAGPFEGRRLAVEPGGAAHLAEWRGRWLLVLSLAAGAGLACGVAALWVVLSRRMLAAQRRGRFLAAVGHELKTPLTAIRLHAETLAAGRVRSGEERGRLLGAVVQQAATLARMIERLLRFSRMERGLEVFSFREVDLDSFLDEVEKEFLSQIGGAKVAFALRRPREKVVFRADPVLLREALLNLLTNAVKYTPQEPKPVELRVERDGDTLVFSVSDRGIGIPEGETKKIFSEFYRVDSGMRVEGAGLGLAIAERTVRAHGGKVEVESEPGKGSTFRLKIPLSGPK